MAEEGQVIACHTVESWNQQFQRGKDSKKLVVIDFTASWCGPCRVISPVLADLARTFPDVIFLKVDVDELQTVAEEWKVESMPTFLFVKEGKVLERFAGANREKLQKTVEKLRSDTATATAIATATATASVSV